MDEAFFAGLVEREKESLRKESDDRQKQLVGKRAMEATCSALFMFLFFFAFSLFFYCPQLRILSPDAAGECRVDRNNVAYISLCKRMMDV